MFRKLSFSAGASKFAPRNVSLKRNAQGNFGFTVEGGLEKNCLPYVVLTVPETALLYVKGKLKDRAEILEVNGRVVAGDKLENILNMIEMAKSDTIIISVLDSASLVSHWKLSQLLQSQKPSGKTAEYIEQIRCNVYDNTIPVVTRPPRKGETPGSCLHVSRDDFQKLIAEQRLLEWGENASNGHLYGTLIPDAPPPSTSLNDEAAGQPISIAPLTQESFVCSVAVVTRTDFYSSWRFELAGGAGTDTLPYVVSIDDAQQLAWAGEPLALNNAIIAVNDTIVVTSTCGAIMELLRKSCSATIAFAAGSSGAPLRFATVMQSRATDNLVTTLLQQDVREALFEAAVLHTTHVPVSFPGRQPWVCVSEHEFSSLAASGRLATWLATDDGIRYGVRMPLETSRTIARPSRLAQVLRMQAAAQAVVAWEGSDGVHLVALPNKAIVVTAAPPGCGLTPGMVVSSINGAAPRDPRTAAASLRGPARLEVRVALAELAEAHALPPKTAQPSHLAIRTTTLAFIVALAVLIVAVLVDVALLGAALQD